jgi:NAD(P)-dependent dehydrogenase (short-subunit alcohol dehydrogenase family)
MDIQGYSAIVTGGASGLGEATVRRLHAAGALVVIVDMNAEKGEALARELGANFAATNVTDAASVQAAIDRAVAQAPLGIAVSCAGIGPAARTVGRDGSAHDLDLYRKVIEVNLIGTFNVLRLAAAAMAKNEPNADGERGVIVNTASVAAFDGQIGQIAYSSSKGGVVGMTLPAARDLMQLGIRVMTIAPGTFDTPLLAGMPQNVREALAAGIPFPRRLGNPAEYGALVETIVKNAYLNGEVIRLDGALRMPPR